MIRSFSCKNFRNVNVKELEFGRINILIGPNNSGKTNFIRALSFCADMITNQEALIGDSAFLTQVYRNGTESIYNKFADTKKQEICMEWKIDLENKTDVNYEFCFHVGSQIQDFFVTKERLDDSSRPKDKVKNFNYFVCHEKLGEGYISKAVNAGEINERIPFKIPENDTVLRQFDRIRLDNKKIYEHSSRQVGRIQQLQEYFKKYYFYSSSQFDLKKIRTPQGMQLDGRTLVKDGSNFVNVFNYYKTRNFLNAMTFLEKLKELMPTLNFADSTVEYDKLVFKVGYEGGQFRLDDLSDGTIKALLLAMLIHLPINDGFSMLAIDEPEMNIHPAWQQTIGHWILSSSNFQQCFISTHSPDFLDIFTEGFKRGTVCVFVFDPREEMAVRKLEYAKLEEELESWELGDLYRVNDPSIGGWPW